MIGLISIIYAICILLIPMVAAFILRGQFSAVGAGISTAVSRIVNGGMTGAKAGAAGGPVGTWEPAQCWSGIGHDGSRRQLAFRCRQRDEAGGGMTHAGRSQAVCRRLIRRADSTRESRVYEGREEHAEEQSL